MKALRRSRIPGAFPAKTSAPRSKLQQLTPLWLATPGSSPAGLQAPAAARVLLAAGEVDLREDVLRLLSAHHPVEAVADGKAALAAARRSPPALILAATRMPVLDGFALLREIRADPAMAAIPVILLSAGADEEALLEGFNLGADDYLITPFSGRELLARVQARLRTARMRREADGTVLEWKNRYEAAVRASGQLLYDWDPGRDAVVYSGDVERIIGYSMEEMAGAIERWIALVHPEDRAAFRGEIDRVTKAPGTPFDMEYRVIRKDGQVIHCEDRGYFFRDAEGKIARLVGFVADVTARKAAEEAVRESEARLRLALEAGGIGIFERSLQTGRIKCSETCVAMLGLTPDAAPCVAAWFARVHPEDRARVEARVCSAIEGGDGYSHEYRILGADDEVHWIESTARVILDDEGRPLLVRGALHDITARKRLQIERDALLDRERAVREEAERANRLKDDFLAIISHELRTPLNAVLGWTSMLRSGRLPEERRQRALETIERNASKQAKLIEDLLDVSRITSGKLRLDVIPLEPIHILREALEAIRPLAESQEIQIETALDPRAGPIRGDPDRLQQIVWNLLNNAVKFTPRGGEIRLGLRRVGASVEISVADTGLGIPSDFLPHVFERFRQADTSVTRAYGGLGLGLAIVHHLVELHGGTIRAQSEGERRGATFTVQLPLAPPPSNAMAWPSKLESSSLPSECPEGFERLRILVVDDDEDARILLVSILEQCGAKVETASSAAEALELIQRFRSDVLLSDIAMPGEDGLTLMRKIRALPPEQGGRIAAVAITACARAEDRTRALRAGFNIHLPKPVESAELLVAIASVSGLLSG